MSEMKMNALVYDDVKHPDHSRNLDNRSSSEAIIEKLKKIEIKNLEKKLQFKCARELNIHGDHQKQPRSDLSVLHLAVGAGMVNVAETFLTMVRSPDEWKILKISETHLATKNLNVMLSEFQRGKGFQLEQAPIVATWSILGHCPEHQQNSVIGYSYIGNPNKFRSPNESEKLESHGIYSSMNDLIVQLSKFERGKGVHRDHPLNKFTSELHESILGDLTEHQRKSVTGHSCIGNPNKVRSPNESEKLEFCETHSNVLLSDLERGEGKVYDDASDNIVKSRRSCLPGILRDISLAATALGCLTLLLPQDPRSDIKVPKLFNQSASMFHGWVISIIFAFCGSLVGLKLMHKKPKLAIVIGYVAILAMLFAFGFLSGPLILLILQMMQRKQYAFAA